MIYIATVVATAAKKAPTAISTALDIWDTSNLKEQWSWPVVCKEAEINAICCQLEA